MIPRVLRRIGLATATFIYPPDRDGLNGFYQIYPQPGKDGGSSEESNSSLRLQEVVDVAQPDVGNAQCVDVIFIHGVGGHARETWTADNGMFWPEKLASRLTRQGVDVRVLTFAYQSRLTSVERRSDMPLPLRAGNLLNAIELRDVGSRPTVFVCHSMGGLILKSLLGQLIGARDDRSARRLLGSLRAIFFLSTPHDGSVYANLLEAFAGFASSVSTSWLSRRNVNLITLNESFVSHWIHRDYCYVKSYAETRPLPWMPRPIVDLDSARLPGTDPTNIDDDHISIAKLRDTDSDVFIDVMNAAVEVAEPCSTRSTEKFHYPVLPSPVPLSVFARAARGIRLVIAASILCGALLTPLLYVVLPALAAVVFYEPAFPELTGNERATEVFVDGRGSAVQTFKNGWLVAKFKSPAQYIAILPSDQVWYAFSDTFIKGSNQECPDNTRLGFCHVLMRNGELLNRLGQAIDPEFGAYLQFGTLNSGGIIYGIPQRGVGIAHHALIAAHLEGWDPAGSAVRQEGIVRTETVSISDYCAAHWWPSSGNETPHPDHRAYVEGAGCEKALFPEQLQSLGYIVR